MNTFSSSSTLFSRAVHFFTRATALVLPSTGQTLALELGGPPPAPALAGAGSGAGAAATIVGTGTPTAAAAPRPSVPANALPTTALEAAPRPRPPRPPRPRVAVDAGGPADGRPPRDRDDAAFRFADLASASASARAFAAFCVARSLAGNFDGVRLTGSRDPPPPPPPPRWRLGSGTARDL
jgi:hypothetical protein